MQEHGEELRCELVEGLAPVEYGIAVKKGNRELLAELNEYIEQSTDAGTVPLISEGTPHDL
jgi:ABC-type amino acid transport substrate-binding protein